jgi:type I restriction enzyme S subunit
MLILVDGENSGEVFVAPSDGYQGSTFKLLDIYNDINNDYVLYFIRSNQQLFRESKVGAAIPHLNKRLFNEIPIMIPPIKEQCMIVSKIKSIFNVLDIISNAL